MLWSNFLFQSTAVHTLPCYCKWPG